MKKKIKLRDMTKEQYQSWVGSNCRHLCSECIFRFTACDFSNCWVDNKGAYSDKFLDQEIEIEVPDLLTEDERDYLRKVALPFMTTYKGIRFERRHGSIYDEILGAVTPTLGKYEKIVLFCFAVTDYLPFKGIEYGDSFTLEELGL